MTSSLLVAHRAPATLRILRRAFSTSIEKLGHVPIGLHAAISQERIDLRSLAWGIFKDLETLRETQIARTSRAVLLSLLLGLDDRLFMRCGSEDHDPLFINSISTGGIIDQLIVRPNAVPALRFHKQDYETDGDRT